MNRLTDVKTRLKHSNLKVEEGGLEQIQLEQFWSRFMWIIIKSAKEKRVNGGSKRKIRKKTSKTNISSKSKKEAGQNFEKYQKSNIEQLEVNFGVQQRESTNRKQISYEAKWKKQKHKGYIGNTIDMERLFRNETNQLIQLERNEIYNKKQSSNKQ